MRESHFAIDAGCQLGESPVWDQRRSQLVWVDITAGQLRTHSPADGGQTILELGGEVSAVMLGQGTDARILAVDHGLRVERSGKLGATLAEAEADRPDNRFNDCRCDPGGRLWAGTMSRRRSQGTAALYRLSPGGPLETVIPGTTISNGLGWSPDQRRMYFVDSLTYRVDLLDFDPLTGEVENRRPLIEVDPDDGLPDGLAIDSEGFLWLCLFGGGAIRRYSPDGQLAEHLRLPLTNPTCPTFGGEDLTTIYVTTARHRLSEAQLAREPRAGAVLAIEAPAAGLPALRFDPELLSAESSPGGPAAVDREHVPGHGTGPI